jgi:hypothetical protein
VNARLPCDSLELVPYTKSITTEQIGCTRTVREKSKATPEQLWNKK